jgi:hypothetical protein
MLVQSVVQDGFASASKWFADADLAPAELAHIANSLSYSSATSGETGQWIEWLSATLPPRRFPRPDKPTTQHLNSETP